MGRKRLHLELQGYLKQASKDLKSSVSTLAGAAWSSIKTQMGGGGEDDAAGTGSAGIAGAGASVAGVEAASASEDPEGKETNTFDMPETSMNAGGTSESPCTPFHLSGCASAHWWGGMVLQPEPRVV